MISILIGALGTVPSETVPKGMENILGKMGIRKRKETIQITALQRSESWRSAQSHCHSDFHESHFFLSSLSIAWGPSDQPYDWGRHPWMRWWLMSPICARKSLGQWEQGMVAAMTDVPVPFLSFLRSSVATFLLVSQTFAPRLTTSRH